MSSEPTQANMQTTWIIYGALCMSMIIYGAVALRLWNLQKKRIPTWLCH